MSKKELERRDFRNPFEVFLLAACLVSGIVQLIIRKQPASINAVLVDPSVRIMWNIMLIIGGGIALFGIVQRNPYNSLRFESIGLLCTAISASVYSMAVIYFGGLQGIFAALMTLSFAAACYIRRHAIEKILGPIRKNASKEDK